MGNIATISSVMISYSVISLATVGIAKIKPGITVYRQPRPENFKMLNHLHGFISVIMMLSVFTTDIPTGFLSFPDKISIWKALAFLGFFGVITFFPWKKLGNNNQRSEQTISHTFPVFLYAFLRLIFISSYEVFFRGVLLLSFSFLAGAAWSIAINISLYTLIHMHKSRKEAIGCIPFGLLVCLFTVWWQSVWPAIIFHSQIAFINEWPPLQKFISRQNQATL